MKIVPITLLLLSFQMALAAAQDDTLGEFLDQGAKPLTPEQVKKIYSGRKQSGETAYARYDLTYESDGTLHGTVRDLSPPYSTSRSQGTWAVDDDGGMCIKEQLVEWKKTHDRCQYFFHLKGRIIMADSLTDRAVNVRVQKIQAR